jgi:hypothetical protein
MERDLLIRALAVRRYEQTRDDPSLLLEVSTYLEWARTEADHLIRILGRLQCADLPQGDGQ